ncbi:MAG: serine/threonine protein kinase [Planctomycetales bacterium]|nr:serine/threonine protein kinase [Planctomycetales bacterium]
MTTRISFVDAMLVSDVVNAAQVEEGREALRLSGAAETADGLAEQMIAIGHLTPYQANQLREGKTKLTLGPYIVTDWIGQGGMGQVFKAVHRVMGRVCAVKVLPAKTTSASIKSFQHEIQTQANLNHPNLVHAYDAGEDGHVHFLVTEYVPGKDLRKLVRRQGPLNMRQAANVFQQVALALAYAHDNGLIHRDIKPGNILVTPDGIAKLSDLGLAGHVDGGDDPHKGKLVGTADYISPEQVRTPDLVTQVSDIYSLGCTAYYAVTGKVPYPGGSNRDKIKRHLDASITVMHPRTFNRDISEEFIEIVADMMEKDPADRIPTALDVAKRLEPWISRGRQSFPQLGTAKSPWTPPPVFDEDEQDTNVGDYAAADSAQESVSQVSATTPSLAALQDTGPDSLSRLRFPTSPYGAESHDVPSPPLPVPRMSRGVSVAIALAVAIPVSMLIGALITFTLIVLLR